MNDGSEGDQTIGILFTKSLPDYLANYCGEEEPYPQLTVKGEGYFGGVEHMFKHDSSSLQEYPQMAEKAAIPNGTYAAMVYSTGIPQEHYNAWLIKHVGFPAKLLKDFHSTTIIGSLIGIPSLLVALFFVSWTIWFCMSAIVIALVIACFLLPKTGAYRAVRAARDTFTREYPMFVVLLE